MRKKIMKRRTYREANRRARFKRRNLGYLPLFENPYPHSDVRSVDMHHINGMICIPLPHRTHMIVKGRNREKHKQRCQEWIQKLFLLDLEALLNP